MHKEEGIRRVQSLIRKWHEDLETISGWKAIHPVLANEIRKALIRISWGSYKIGLATHEKIES